MSRLRRYSESGASQEHIRSVQADAGDAALDAHAGSEIFKAYGNVLPDIFVSYCTESTFSFLAAAVKQRFVIANDVSYKHGENDGTHSGLDGQTLAFGPGWGTGPCEKSWQREVTAPVGMPSLLPRELNHLH